MKRRGMKPFDGDALEGEICPECVLVGPRGAGVLPDRTPGGGAGDEGAEVRRCLGFKSPLRHGDEMKRDHGFSSGSKMGI